MARTTSSEKEHALVDGAAIAEDDYLGPAVVIEVRGRKVEIELPGGEHRIATLALAYLYEPVPGDVLLVIGKPAGWYGIGVLHAAGRAVLAFHGDVDVRSVDGTLTLSGAKGVKVEGAEVEVHTRKLKMVADAVVQRFTSVYQRVSDLLNVHAGKSHTVVDGTSVAQSESATILTKDTMTINGKEIHLG